MRIQVDVNHHFPREEEVPPWAKTLLAKVNLGLQRLESMMTVKDDIKEILADTREQKTLIEGLKTYIQGLRDMVTAALADKLDDEDKANLKEIFDTAEANRAAAAEALTTNTPTPPPADAPPPPVEPAPNP